MRAASYKLSLINLALAVVAVLSALKLAGVIGWGWLWIFSPILGLWFISLGVICFASLIAGCFLLWGLIAVTIEKRAGK